MPRAFTVFALALAAAACDSHAASVCQDIGYCTTQSDDQVSACKSEARQLSAEASRSSCDKAYADYFQCADDKYVCDGNTPGFPGCEAMRATLALCLVRGRANNACGELANRLAACPAADGGSPPDVPQPCTDPGVCGARCYLDQVADVCAPTPRDLADYQRCAASCPL